jgi:hypothetical protein
MRLFGANYARVGVANEPPVERRHGALFAYSGYDLEAVGGQQ